eukprot:NODE_458_length_8223_cov_0.302683.p2 type:complete len:321 gc:universal NODE_458_length_8223_cov_0.302683:1549-587(-)
MGFIFFNGAGVSLAAGIPDFRSSTGIFKLKISEKGSSYDLFDATQALRTKENYSEWLRGMASLHDMIADVKPTLFHHFLVRLSELGKLQRVYTQNIDELESSAGLKDDKIVLLHGTIHSVYCMNCRHVEKTVPLIPEFQKGKVAPCTRCVEIRNERERKGLRQRSVGTLRPQVVLYNEFHPNSDKITSFLKKDRKKLHTIVIIGTSLKVHGLKQSIKDICVGNEVWVVNPDENLKIPSDLKPLITKHLHYTADEFVEYMDTHVLKQSTMDSFFKKSTPAREVKKKLNIPILEQHKNKGSKDLENKYVGPAIPLISKRLNK